MSTTRSAVRRPCSDGCSVARTRSSPKSYKSCAIGWTAARKSASSSSRYGSVILEDSAVNLLADKLFLPVPEMARKWQSCTCTRSKECRTSALHPTAAASRRSGYSVSSAAAAGEWNVRRRRLQLRPDERAIREVHSTWIEAVNAGDLVSLLSLMADDVVFLNPGQAPFGREGFSPGFSAAHQQARINCISELEDVVVVGEVAYTLSRDSLSATPRAGGEAMQLAGHRITVYRKQPDGRWLLARDAHTLSPVAKLRS